MGSKFSKKKEATPVGGTPGAPAAAATGATLGSSRERRTVVTDYQVRPLSHRRQLAPPLTEVIVALQHLNEVHVTPQHLPPVWPMIRWAVLQRSPHPSVEWVSKAAAVFPELSTIVFPPDCPAGVIRQVVDSRPTLVSLTLWSARDYSLKRGFRLNNSVYHTLSKLVLRKSLEAVDFESISRLYATQFSATGAPSALTHLDLTANVIEVPCLAALLTATGDLRTLILASCYAGTDVGILSDMAFASLPKLEVVDLSRTRAAVLQIADIGMHCPELRELKIAGWISEVSVTKQHTARYMSPVSDPNVERLLSRCSNLTSLDLSTTSVLLALSKALQSLTSLTRLIMRCGMASNETLIGIAPVAKRLRELDIRAANGVSDVGLVAILPTLPELKRLGLGAIGDTITDATMFAIARYCPLLEGLDVGGANITDEGLSAVAKGCRYIADMVLSDTRGQVTDAGIDVLTQHCTALSSLDLSNTDGGVTGAGVRYIAARCFALRTLDVSVNRDIDTACLLTFADNEVLLDQLNVNCCRFVEIDRLSTVALEVIGV